MSTFATVDDVIKRYKPLTTDEIEKAEVILEDVTSALRVEGKKCNVDLDEKAQDEDYANVLRMVTCDIVIRRLEQDENSSSTLSQESQSALGYSWSGTYVNTGGGTSILNKDLKTLGLKRQACRFADVYGFDVEDE